MLENLKILVVEDREDNRFLMVQILQKNNCQVDVAENGQQALDMLSIEDFDIVIMDCKLPDLDGREVTRQIREREGCEKHTIVIGVTAYAMLGDRETCLDAGMDAYIKKPFRINEFLLMLAYYASQING